MSRILVFTDGSFTLKNNQSKAGYGVYFPLHQEYNLSASIPPKKTNIRAETTAVIAALQTIKDNKEAFNLEEAKYIKIYTDCMYVVKSFNIWIHKWIKNEYKDIKNTDLLKEAQKLIESFQIPVKFRHVYGHQRQPSIKEEKKWFRWYCNNEADRLAKQGSG